MQLFQTFSVFRLERKSCEVFNNHDYSNSKLNIFVLNKNFYNNDQKLKFYIH